MKDLYGSNKTGYNFFSYFILLIDFIILALLAMCQGPFGGQDVLTIAINRPKHPSHVHATEANVMIKYYFGPAPRGSRTSSSMAIEDLEQLTQKI